MDSATNNTGIDQTSLLVINGNPAIAYRNSTAFTLKYVRSSVSDPNGLGLSTATAVIADGTNGGGSTASLQLIGGIPAIANINLSNGTGRIPSRGICKAAIGDNPSFKAHFKFAMTPQRSEIGSFCWRDANVTASPKKNHQ